MLTLTDIVVSAGDLLVRWTATTAPDEAVHSTAAVFIESGTRCLQHSRLNALPLTTLTHILTLSLTPTSLTQSNTNITHSV